MSAADDSSAPPRITFSHLFGEVCWLLTQSPLHRKLPIAALERIAVPAVAKEQLFIFREGDQPAGAAFWAYCNDAAAAKLDQGLLTAKPPFDLDDWTSGDQLWLVDLIAPFATAQNRHREIMMADLIAGPLRGKAFSFHSTDEKSGKRSVKHVPADAFEKLTEAVHGRVGHA